MAQSSGGGDIIKYGLLAVGGYLLYNWWVSQPATTATAPVTTIPLPPSVPVTPAGGGGAAPPPPVVNPPPPSGGSGGAPPPAGGVGAASLAQALNAAAGNSASSTLNADQWSYYYTNTGHTPIDSSVFSQLFFPNGRPSDPSQNPQMTAAQFVAAIATKGLNGFGASLVPMGPQMVPPGFNPPIIVGRLPGGGFAGMGAVRIPVPYLRRY
jgi:hypothetical protein